MIAIGFYVGWAIVLACIGVLLTAGWVGIFLIMLPFLSFGAVCACMWLFECMFGYRYEQREEARLKELFKPNGDQGDNK